MKKFTIILSMLSICFLLLSNLHLYCQVLIHKTAGDEQREWRQIYHIRKMQSLVLGGLISLVLASLILKVALR